MKIFISFLVWAVVVLPLSIIGLPITILLLKTKWRGRTTIWGNAKWGRADTHPDYKAVTYWRQLNWLVWRNPVNNLQSKTLAVKMGEYHLYGKDPIGDKIAGGRYRVKMGWAWEYYRIIPYKLFGKKLCVRLRAGWKINDNAAMLVGFVFSFNPFKPYAGA